MKIYCTKCGAMPGRMHDSNFNDVRWYCYKCRRAIPSSEVDRRASPGTPLANTDPPIENHPLNWPMIITAGIISIGSVIFALSSGCAPLAINSRHYQRDVAECLVETHNAVWYGVTTERTEDEKPVQ